MKNACVAASIPGLLRPSLGSRHHAPDPDPVSLHGGLAGKGSCLELKGTNPRLPTLASMKAATKARFSTGTTYLHDLLGQDAADHGTHWDHLREAEPTRQDRRLGAQNMKGWGTNLTATSIPGTTMGSP